jgi:hypothetical protein
MNNEVKQTYLSLSRVTSLFEKSLYLRAYIEALQEEVARYERSPYLDKPIGEASLEETRFKLGGSEEERQATKNYTNTIEMRNIAKKAAESRRPSYMRFAMENSLLVLAAAFALGVIAYGIAYLVLAGLHGWKFEYFDVTLNEDFFSLFLPDSWCWGGRTLFFGIFLFSLLAYIIALCINAPIYHAKSDLYSYAVAKRVELGMNHYVINARKERELKRAIARYKQALQIIEKEMAYSARYLDMPSEDRSNYLSYYFYAETLLDNKASDFYEASYLYQEALANKQYPSSLTELEKRQYSSPSLLKLTSNIKDAYGDFQRLVIEPNETYPYRNAFFILRANNETKKWVGVELLKEPA